MTTLAALIWAWSLTLFPITAILTFISTIVTCLSVPNHAPAGVRFPQISELGTGEAHRYFIIGFVLLFVQLLVVVLGRVQFLFQSQFLVNRWLIFFIHLLAFLSSLFMLLMAICSIEDNLSVHLTGAFGLFGLLSLYCFLQTFLIIYLYRQREDAPNHSNSLYPIWFTLCSLLLLISFIVWVVTADGIAEYIAASAPFLYLLGYVPQFYFRARERKRDTVWPRAIRFSIDEDTR